VGLPRTKITKAWTQKTCKCRAGGEMLSSAGPKKKIRSK